MFSGAFRCQSGGFAHSSHGTRGPFPFRRAPPDACGGRAEWPGCEWPGLRTVPGARAHKYQTPRLRQECRAGRVGLRGGSLSRPSTGEARLRGGCHGPPLAPLPPGPALCWEQCLEPVCGPGLARPQRLLLSPEGARRLLPLARGDTPERSGEGTPESTRDCAHSACPASVSVQSALEQTPCRLCFLWARKAEAEAPRFFLPLRRGGPRALPQRHTGAPQGGPRPNMALTVPPRALSPALGPPGPGPPPLDPHTGSTVSVLPFPGGCYPATVTSPRAPHPTRRGALEPTLAGLRRPGAWCLGDTGC